MKFKAGMRVEACSLERGYEGAWFEGVILSCKRDNCEMLYDKFMGEDGDQPLVEKLSYRQLRPRPPHTDARNWAIGDLVEAYENDAWWRGVVMKVLPAQQYYVEFPETVSDNVFHQSNIRLRQDWGKGKWYLPLPLPSPLPLKVARRRNSSLKFPVPKDNLFEKSRMDIDNEECSLSIYESCTAFVQSSLNRKIDMQDKKNRTDHATKYSCTHDHTEKINGIRLADENIHEKEVNVYRSVLQFFSARKTLSWETELLLTELRIELHITCDEHLLELQKLKLASEVKMYSS